MSKQIIMNLPQDELNGLSTQAEGLRFYFHKSLWTTSFFSLLLELYIMMKDINNQCLENNDNTTKPRS